LGTHEGGQISLKTTNRPRAGVGKGRRRQPDLRLRARGGTAVTLPPRMRTPPASSALFRSSIRIDRDGAEIRAETVCSLL